MPAYPLSWVTEQLAVGHAPMSYDELGSIREQGIDGIVNLCGEYCDLHQIEKDYGFEVLYLPVQDNRAPSLQETEKALQWLDEAIYLGKKILVHCTHGIGRTGTFVTAYLLRRGFSMKLAREKLKQTRAESTSFDQWWFLRKLGRKQGRLTIREPSLEGSRLVNLAPYFEEYEGIVNETESALDSGCSRSPDAPRCGRDHDRCCHRFFNLQLIEATYLSHHLNRKLTSEDRLDAIQRAVAAHRVACRGLPGSLAESPPPGAENEDSCEIFPLEPPGYVCPLSIQQKCAAFPYRPVICRGDGITGNKAFSLNGSITAFMTSRKGFFLI
jgi:protein-tyrosine phosphatase